MEELILIALLAGAGVIVGRNRNRIKQKRFSMNDLKSEIRDLPGNLRKLGGAAAAKIESLTEEPAPAEDLPEQENSTKPVQKDKKSKDD